MHQPQSKLSHTASASRSVAAARMSTVGTRASFYFGYWFSHWRA